MKILKLTLIFLSLTTLAYADFTPPSAAYSPDAFDVLLAHFDEVDGSTTPDDASTSNHTITANGNAQTDSGVTKFNNTSLLDGTGDFWSIAAHANFNFPANVTIDCWVYFDATISAAMAIWGIGNTEFKLYIVDTLDNVYLYSNGASTNQAITAVSKQVWHHWAVARNGSTMTVYLDGTTIFTRTDSGEINESGINGLAIGTYNTAGESQFLDGNVEEFRVSKGVDRYAAASGKQFIWITKLIDNFNPDIIGTPMWSCKIKTMKWWKNLKC